MLIVKYLFTPLTIGIALKQYSFHTQKCLNDVYKYGISFNSFFHLSPSLCFLPNLHPTVAKPLIIAVSHYNCTCHDN